MTSLTIVLVTRNAMPFAEQAVVQINAAAREYGAEVVAVDGHSTDGTWEVLGGTSGWLLAQQTQPGLAAARNEALAAATGEVVAFLDADDTWHPDKLERQLHALSTEPAADVVSCHLIKAGVGIEVVSPQPALTPSGCLFRREVFQRVGAFDTRYTIAADHEWFARARSRGARIDVLPETLLTKHMHATNLSHDRSTYRRELAQAFRELSAGQPG